MEDIVELTMEQLKTMKRTELQKICKKIGVKANMKTEKLVEELMNYYNKSKKNVEANLTEILNANSEPTEELKKAEETKTGLIETSEFEMPEEEEEAKDSSTSKIKKEKSAKAPSKIPKLHQKTPKRNEPKDWAKIHQKQFEMMDSLDVYMNKKRKRAEDLCNSAKKAKVRGNKQAVLTEEKPQMQKIKDTQKTKAPAKSVNSTVATPKLQPSTQKRLTFNFTSSTKENAMPTPKVAKQPITVAEHKPATPFRFNSSNAVPFGSPTPRATFDLKASLAKPLKYKPYTGKLPTPPYAKNSPKLSVKKTDKKIIHRKDVKAVKVKSGNDRRERITKRQSRARESAVSRRRGLVH